MPQKVRERRAALWERKGQPDYSSGVELYQTEPSLLFLEGFEELPSRWDDDGSVGYSVVRDTARSWRGGACLNLMTGTAADNWALYQGNFGMVHSLKALMDLAISFPAADAQEFYIYFVRFLGTERADFGVLYNFAEEFWRYLDSDAVWSPIPDSDQALRQNPDVFHRVWLGVDFDRSEYLYMQCNELLLSLAGEGPRVQASALDPYAAVLVNVQSGAVMSKSFYIDNVRVAEIV